MTNDRHYTPSDVADLLVEAVQCRRVSSVADFAVGSGELLKAALKRWPRARYAGVDIDVTALKSIRRSHPGWSRCRANFLRPEEVDAELTNAGCVKKFDVVLLNPPFSCRHIKTIPIGVDQTTIIRCSQALGFVIRALSYCRKGGQVVAILPSGSRSSVRDEAGWKHLKSRYIVEALRSLEDGTFPKCSASAEIVRFTVPLSIPNPITVPNYAPAGEFIGEPDILIVRGCMSMHRTGIDRSDVPVLHTTDMVSNRVRPVGRFAPKGRLLERKLHLLLPRVGKPMREKLCLYQPTRMALSDCILGLVGRTTGVTEAVKSTISRNWDHFAALYRGTGARYISVLQLGRFLAQHGYSWTFNSSQLSQRTILEHQPIPDKRLLRKVG